MRILAKKMNVEWNLLTFRVIPIFAVSPTFWAVFLVILPLLLLLSAPVQLKIAEVLASRHRPTFLLLVAACRVLFVCKDERVRGRELPWEKHSWDYSRSRLGISYVWLIL